MNPVLSRIIRHGKTEVVAQQHVTRVVGIDPQRMVVAGPCPGPVPSLAAVARLLDDRAQQINMVGVIRINTDLAIVRPALRRIVVRADLRPRSATIVGPVDRAQTRVVIPSPRDRPLENTRIENARIAAINVEANPAQLFVREAARQFLPGASPVGRFVDPTPHPALREVPRAALLVPRRRVKHIRIIGIHNNVNHSKVSPVLGNPERLHPRSSPVDRLIQSPL